MILLDLHNCLSHRHFAYASQFCGIKAHRILARLETKYIAFNDENPDVKTEFFIYIETPYNAQKYRARKLESNISGDKDLSLIMFRDD